MFFNTEVVVLFVAVFGASWTPDGAVRGLAAARHHHHRKNFRQRDGKASMTSPSMGASLNRNQPFYGFPSIRSGPSGFPLSAPYYFPGQTVYAFNPLALQAANQNYLTNGGYQYPVQPGYLYHPRNLLSNQPNPLGSIVFGSISSGSGQISINNIQANSIQGPFTTQINNYWAPVHSEFGSNYGRIISQPGTISGNSFSK